MIFEEDFGLAYHPAFHFQTKKEQAAVIRSHVHCFLEIESQKLVPIIPVQNINNHSIFQIISCNQPAQEFDKRNAMSESTLADANCFNQITGTNLFRQVISIQGHIGRRRHIPPQTTDKMGRSINQFLQKLNQRLACFHGNGLHLTRLRKLSLRHRVESLLFLFAEKNHHYHDLKL